MDLESREIKLILNSLDLLITKIIFTSELTEKKKNEKVVEVNKLMLKIDKLKNTD